MLDWHTHLSDGEAVPIAVDIYEGHPLLQVHLCGDCESIKIKKTDKNKNIKIENLPQVEHYKQHEVCHLFEEGRFVADIPHPFPSAF